MLALSPLYPKLTGSKTTTTLYSPLNAGKRFSKNAAMPSL
ncbi:hypothetical protein protein [Bacillus cereus G9241]|nr:hypothetical protein protein [Bacillus cereus G9241]